MRNQTRIIVLILVSVIVLSAACDREATTAEHSWEVVTPESVGLNTDSLANLVADIRNDEYSNIHGLLIIRNGKLAFEAYFSGEDEKRGIPQGVVDYDASMLHDARSITKSVTSALMGLALADEANFALQKSIYDFFPEYADLSLPENPTINLSHVLSMSAGWKWDEDRFPYGDKRNSETAMDHANDPYRFVLEAPVVFTPGEGFRYSGGNTMLIAAIIENKTEMRIDKFAEMALFEPLGIRSYEWLAYPDGTPIAASGLRLKPRDMAKIGQMYLDGGKWKGRQIVPEYWVKASLSPHTNINNRPFGFQNYGYQWWLGTAKVGDSYVPFSAAVGWGGQRILLVPSMDLVLVMTAGLYKSRRQTDITFEILLDRVLPAIRLNNQS